jgi:glycosyltransferase involved in cell wall biosynthesis
VTPAHNEEATVEMTIRSVLSQSLLPTEWVIVSDRSSDRTDEIVGKFAAKHHFLKLKRNEGEPTHSFDAVVKATEIGLKSLTTLDYAYVGLLDADVRFPPDYYEKLIMEFERDSQLGLAGGLVLDLGHTRERPFQNLNEVAGATQLFRRECFDGLGNLIAIHEGGWDAITCAQARMNGYRTTTFPYLIMDHLKPRNAAIGNRVRGNFQLGVRDYILGAHPLFEIAKCGNRLGESPLLVSSFCRFAGYFSALCLRRQRYRGEVFEFMRREQLNRLAALFVRRPNR